MKQHSNTYGLSIVEVMIGIFIFTLGLSAVYMVISSTVSINMYNKNFIIASNLAREQSELIRNVRDTNYIRFQKWNMLDPYGVDYYTGFTGSVDGGWYKLQNDFSNEKVIVSTGTTLSDFKGALINPLDTSEEQYRLCTNTLKQYGYCDAFYTKQTPFYKYIEIQPLTETIDPHSPVIQNAFKVRSQVYWSQKGIYSTQVDTILTDWQRL